MSLMKLLIGIVLVLLIMYFVSEWRKWKKRAKKEAEISEVELENDLLNADETIALTRADHKRRRREIDAINNPDEEK